MSQPSPGYYDPFPKRSLERPIALTGFMGAPVAAVGRALAALTGHPIHDLQRAVEHRLGASLEAAILERGLAAVRHHEEKLLADALRSQPAGVLALTHGVLLGADLRRRVREEARLVYLRVPFEDLVARLARQVAAAPGAHYAWLGGRVPETEVLHPVFLEREPGYLEADLVVDIGERAPSAVARDLVARLRLD